MAVRRQERRGTGAEWSAANPVLAEGEIGMEIAPSGLIERFKIGDGTTEWNDLAFPTYESDEVVSALLNDPESNVTTILAGILADPETPAGASLAGTYASLTTAAVLNEDGDLEVDGGVVLELPIDIPDSTPDADPLRRWHDKLRDGTNPRLAFYGDSTSLRTNTGIPEYLYQQHVSRHKGPLSGLTMADNTGIYGGGNNGQTAAGFYATRGGASAADPAVTWPRMVADAPDLAVLSFGINDVRSGATSLAAFTTLLRTIVTAFQTDLPGCDLLLRMPNTFCGTTGGYLTPGTTAAAQTYSTLLRGAYLTIEGEFSNVAVADIQGNVFGLNAFDTHPLLGDQIHPNAEGYNAIADFLVRRYIALPESRWAQESWLTPTTQVGPAPVAASVRYVRPVKINTAGSGFFDLTNSDLYEQIGRGGQIPLLTADVIYVDGLATPIALTSASFSQVSYDVARVFLTGDWTAINGKSATVTGNHPAEGMVAGRYSTQSTGVAIDPASIAAGGTADVTSTLSGARPGMGVIAVPVSGSISGLMCQAFVTSNDTITVRFFNPTAGAIDLAVGHFNFYLAR